MKIINVVFGALLTALLIFTSCSKQETIISESVAPTETLSGKKIDLALPVGFENHSETQLEAYFSELKPVELEALAISYKVKSYLTHLNKVDVVQGNMIFGELYANVDLTNYLTERELAAMADFVPAEDYSRCPTLLSCYTNSPWCRSNLDLAIYRRCNGSYYGYCINCYG